MPSLPTGTVTFLFTDIEGSTRLLEHLGDRYADALTQYRHLLAIEGRANEMAFGLLQLEPHTRKMSATKLLSNRKLRETASSISRGIRRQGC